MMITTAVGLAAALAFAPSPGDERVTLGGATADESVHVAAEQYAAAPAPVPAVGSAASDSSSVPAPPIRQWRITPAMCFLRDLGGATAFAESCDEGHQLAYAGIECEDDEQAVGALFEQRRESGEWSDAALVEEESCIAQRRQQVDIPAAAARAFREMQIAPSDVNVQPPDGWTLVNVDTIAFTDRDPRTMSTNLFGIPVEIRAVPSSYSWNFGDGSTPLTTTDPGAPYPAHTVAHAYAKQGTATISLTTTWHGQFRLAGEPTWRDVAGEGTTVSSSGSLEILEARARLVEDLYDE
ncbi:PKD domain-containing protein [Promicromonospora sp. AC04]|uniref:PKD domain-containing protein n=1 Tax=Promicromonospora sp. AC04 TaxID=2135723 RepID=UPI0011B29724|nr:PKD domain-containing protein [Promicromonospora sp. AC04]